MAKYHINDKGEVRACRAVSRPCIFASDRHYETASQALEANEARLEKEHHILSFYSPESKKELDFLIDYDVRKYGKDRLTTVDTVLYDEDSDSVLMIKRGNYPWRGQWALPGGFIDGEEDSVAAAMRELVEETNVVLEEPARPKGELSGDSIDPRGYLETQVFLAKVDPRSIKPEAGDDATMAKWLKRSEIKTLLESGKLVPHHADLVEQALSD